MGKNDLEKKKISKIKRQREYKMDPPKTKFELINQILCRWWYGMTNPYSSWEQDFENELQEKQLILVNPEDVKKDGEIHDGKIKVTKIDQFPGWFKD